MNYRIYYDDGLSGNPYFKRIIKNAASLSIPAEPMAKYRKGKGNIIISENRGDFIKKCPGTRDFVCCDYYIIDLIFNCPLGCSYCFLNAYSESDDIVIYTNLDRLFEEIRALENNSILPYRIGTGEYSDSLFFDFLTGYSRDLVEFFSGMEKGILELKTKTAETGRLEDIGDPGSTVISWSLNPERIISSEEGFSAPLSDRLKAAARCAKKGFMTGFHFDPVVKYPGWEDDYRRVIETLAAAVPAGRIAWISLGTLRFSPAWKDTMKKHFKNTSLLYEDFVLCPDGKMRYQKKIRLDIYGKMLQYIHDIIGFVPVYLCMEPPYIWKKLPSCGAGKAPGFSFGVRRKGKNNLLSR
ncbi:MAG: hypothetical protein A2X49_00205 [Lentisphaerae bacterium GWF2_52_8]|nr:MAG: hypothetical protein A2X49_00205 [Lentisphaerae bacterium GWF2_52_8]